MPSERPRRGAKGPDRRCTSGPSGRRLLDAFRAAARRGQVRLEVVDSGLCRWSNRALDLQVFEFLQDDLESRAGFHPERNQVVAADEALDL